MVKSLVGAFIPPKQNASSEERTNYNNQGALTIIISLVIFTGTEH